MIIRKRRLPLTITRQRIRSRKSAGCERGGGGGDDDSCDAISIVINNGTKYKKVSKHKSYLARSNSTTINGFVGF